MLGRRVVTATLVVLPLVSVCSSGSGTEVGTASSTASCPSPPSSGDTFPGGAASQVPHPANAELPRRLPVTIAGQDEVQFTTATPLSVAASFVKAQYAAAGYEIVGGDAEAHEADILWRHGDAQGKTRLSGAGCTTTWTVLALPTGVRLQDKDNHEHN